MVTQQWKFNYVGTKNEFILNNATVDNKQFCQVKNDSDFNIPLDNDIMDFRRGGVIHKIVRSVIRSMLITNAKISDIVSVAEKQILTMTKQDQACYYSNGGTSGIAFPIGVNVNNIVAHDTKISNLDDRVLCRGDLVKIDIGIHINGNIIDSAFTHIVTDKNNERDYDNPYDSVLGASKDAMYSAISLSGPDQTLYEISETIDEIIKSYEVNIGSKYIPIIPVDNIGGHNINKYELHGGKLILSSPNFDLQNGQRMQDNEIYAIETYATTGYGNMTHFDTLSNITHFKEGSNTKSKKNDLSKWIMKRNGLPFSLEWARDKANVPKLQKFLKMGIENGQIIAYPPLYDVPNSVVAQFEHTIRVKDGSVEIFSLGEDY